MLYLWLKTFHVLLAIVAVGFIISILQDSAETALNSSTDVVFTAAAAGRHRPVQRPTGGEQRVGTRVVRDPD